MWALPWRLNCCLAGWQGRWGDVYPPPLEKKPVSSNPVLAILLSTTWKRQVLHWNAVFSPLNWWVFLIKCPPAASSQVGSHSTGGGCQFPHKFGKAPHRHPQDARHSWGMGHCWVLLKNEVAASECYFGQKHPVLHHTGACPADWIKPSPGVGIFWVWNK